MAKKSKLSTDQVAGKLLAGGFGARPTANPASPQAPADPVGPTPMVVTLDQVRPSHVDPRIQRNPLYDEIKESIRARGLDHTPTITRRPGEDFFVIRDGGNTRLSILKELWSETRDDRYFRMSVLFKPWDSEIRALTGHMAENDMRGGLALIERAIGLEKARKLYEEADGKEISQRELSRRLKEDGYPVSNSTISRMQDIIRYLLPAIPQLLYGGLGIDPAVRLVALRKAASAAWEKNGPSNSVESFDEVFVQALNGFERYDFQRMQDELIGQMSEALGVDYNILTMDIQEEADKSRRPGAESSAAATTTPLVDEQEQEPEAAASLTDTSTGQAPVLPNVDAATPKKSPVSKEKAATDTALPNPPPQPPESASPGDESKIRTEIYQLVQGIASESGVEHGIVESQASLGFGYQGDQNLEPGAAAVLSALLSLNQFYDRVKASLQGIEVQEGELMDSQFSAQMGHLMMGVPAGASGAPSDNCGRLSDSAVMKLFRVIQLARRLIDLDDNVQE